MDLLADVALVTVAHQRAGKQARLAKNLETIADPPSQDHRSCELLHRLHDRREAGDGAGTEIVAIREPAGHQDGVAALKVVRSMPEKGDRGLNHRRENVVGIVIAVGTGEDEDAKLQALRVAEERRRI